MSATEQLLTDIADRLKAVEGENAKLREDLSEANLKRMVGDGVVAAFDDEETVRKIRFAKPEPKLVGTKYSRFGYTTADIEWLYDHMKARQRVGFEGPSESLTNAFQAVSDAYYLTAEEIREAGLRELDEEFKRLPRFPGKARAYADAKRAMDTAESGFGSQLIGAQYVGDLWDVSRDLGVIAPLFRSFDMQAPTAYLPVEAGFPEMLFVGESTENNSANYTTVKTASQRVSVTAYKFVIHQMWSGEMQEDSIIAFVPFLRMEAARALAFYTDSVVMNGDQTNAGTGNINLDDADPADTKHYLALDGIRHAALVDNTANTVNVAAVITLDTFRAMRATMRDTTRLVDWGHPVNRNDLIFAADPDTADRIDLLDEVMNWKIQNSDDLLNGQTTRILGHPVIRTFVVSKTEADGKLSTTGSNNTLGQVVGFNRTGGVLGWRRRVQLALEPLPATDQYRHVYSLRFGFGRFTPTGAASGQEWASVARNITA